MLAAQCYSQAVAMRPAAVTPRLDLARAWRSAGRWRHAAGAYREATAIEPDHPVAVRGLTDVLLHLAASPGAQGDADPSPKLAAEALLLSEKTVAAQPDDAMGHVQKGQALALLARTEEAEASFDRAAALAPHDARIVLARLAFHAQTARTAVARRTLEELAESGAWEPERLAWVLAQGCRILGDRPAAEEHYLDALSADPDSSLLQREAGEYFSGADAARAIQLIRRALSAAPDALPLQKLLADLEREREAQP
jgi:tetratricopeptide (TPR) repeat protein